MSEKTVNIITHISNINEEVVSFLNESIDNKAETKIKSKIIIVVFLLKTEKTSKFPKINIAYKKETIKFPPIKIK